MLTQPIALAKEKAAEYVALSVSTFERMVRAGDIPKPVLVGPRRVAWRTSDLTDWFNARPLSDLLPPKNTGYGRAGKPKTAFPAGH